MKKIKFENGTLVSNAKVEIGGTIYDVTPEQYEGTTPLSASNMNAIQENAENAINEVSLNLEQLKTSIENNHTYSKEETKIGTWIDGKPIYRKVISIGSLPSKGTVKINHNISNIKNVINSSMIWYDTSDTAWWQNRRWDSTSIDISYNVNSNTIWINGTGVNWNTRTKDTYVIVEYTKSTD